MPRFEFALHGGNHPDRSSPYTLFRPRVSRGCSAEKANQLIWRHLHLHRRVLLLLDIPGKAGRGQRRRSSPPKFQQGTYLLKHMARRECRIAKTSPSF